MFKKIWIIETNVYIFVSQSETQSKYKLIKMLSETQKELLTTIRQKLKHGDIGKIADATKKSTVWVGNALSLSTDTYSEEIVAEAVRIIEKREQDTKKLLKKIAA